MNNNRRPRSVQTHIFTSRLFSLDSLEPTTTPPTTTPTTEHNRNADVVGEMACGLWCFSGCTQIVPNILNVMNNITKLGTSA